MSIAAREALKALTFLAAWYLLFYLCLGAHEGFHSIAAVALGAKATYIVYGYLWLFPVEGACIVLWPFQPTALHRGLVGVSGGLGTATLIALLDRAIKPHGRWSRYLDYASNIHLGQQILYGVVEGLVMAGLVDWWLLWYGWWVGLGVGILLALLEANGVVEV